MCLGALLNLNTSVAARKQNGKRNSTRWDVGKITLSYTITEQISIKCWEYSGFLLLLLQCALIVLENSHHLSQPIRCKDKTNHSLVSHVFPRFRYCFPSKNDFSLAACNFFFNVPIGCWGYVILVLWHRIEKRSFWTSGVQSKNLHSPTFKLSEGYFDSIKRKNKLERKARQTCQSINSFGTILLFPSKSTTHGLEKKKV